MCHEPQFDPKSLQQDSVGLMSCGETRSPRENNSEVSVEFFSNFAVHRKVTESYLHWFKAFKSGKIGESRIWENPDEDQSFLRFADPRDFVSRPTEVIAQFLSEILLLHFLDSTVQDHTEFQTLILRKQQTTCFSWNRFLKAKTRDQKTLLD